MLTDFEPSALCDMLIFDIVNISLYEPTAAFLKSNPAERVYVMPLTTTVIVRELILYD